jgi:cob(I)alamin adenosyltransferase
MLFTRKGDGGTTKTFGCDQRISKSSTIAEALGGLDEINSLLGLCKLKAREINLTYGQGVAIYDVVNNIQQNLFTVQAELAGADKHLAEVKVKEVEEIINIIEAELPPIRTFFVSGGTECAATFDFARTVARRAERRVVAAVAEGNVKLGEFTLPFLNRLSSILYALARLSNAKSGITEEPPTYS